MTDKQSWFREIEAWTLRKEWRTWFAHGLITLIPALAAGWLGAFAALCFYAGREWGQYEQERKDGVEPNVRDHVMDLVLPTLLLVLWGILFWDRTPVIPESPHPLLGH